MSSNSFLRTVRGRRVFRRRIPADLIDRFGGQRELVQSLGSLPHDRALEKARRLAVQTDELFSQMRTNRNLTADEAVRLAQDHYAELMAEAEKVHRSRSQTREQIIQLHEQNKATIKDFRLSLASNDTALVRGLADRLLAEAGLSVDPDSDEDRHFRTLLLRGVVAAAETIGARAAGDFGFRPADDVFKAVLPTAATKSVPTFTEAFERYSTEKVRTGAWRADMQRENANTRALFVELAGDKRLDRYARTDVSDFVHAIQHLPALRGKSPRFKGKTLADLVAMAKADPSIETLSPKSVKKHSSNVSSFFSWAVGQGYVEANPAKGVFKAPKRIVNRNAERDAWSPDQLRKLFMSPLYQGCKSAFYRSQPGDQVIRDAKFWLPLLGAFHPVRLEEVAQLRLEDVREELGVTYMHIHGTDDEEGEAPARKVKSLAAWRKVPVHHTLIDIGFFDHIAERRRKGDTMVFPELKPGGTAQRYGFTFTKWFGNYRKGLGLQAVDFHSFRHSAITALQRAGTHPDLIDQLDGHQAPGERSRYGKGFELSALKAAIDSICYQGIDIGLIVGQQR